MQKGIKQAILGKWLGTEVRLHVLQSAIGQTRHESSNFQKQKYKGRVTI